MFDLITGQIERPLREKAPGSKITSIVLHVVVLTLIVGIPLLRVTRMLPPIPVPSMRAFVEPSMPAPALPPPSVPARPVPLRASPPRAAAPSVPSEPVPPAPIAAPDTIDAKATAVPSSGGGSPTGTAAGSGEGGVAGGELIASAAPIPPPPAPAAPPPTAPVRVGGQFKAPALLHRVEPEYPPLAASAHLTGTVILEAVVGRDGCVQSVKVLRSVNTLLDDAAIAALKQWQYAPLLLNGTPMPFVLTVTFTFRT